MLNVRHHTSEDYASLRDMEGTEVGILSVSDRDCLDELGAALVKANKHVRFGICLLHRHFCVTDDEVIVETISGDKVSIFPISRVKADNQLVAITLQFRGNSSATLDLIGLEYLAPGHGIRVSPVQEDEAEILCTLREILAKRGKVERFGVRLIHHEINAAEGEVLFETSDLEHRVLNFEPGKNTDPRIAKSIETLWVWDVGIGRNGESIAITHCPAQCQRYCVKTGLGHDPRGHDSKGHGPSTGHHRRKLMN